MRVAGHKWLGRRMGAGCRYFCGFALGWNECGGERRGRRGNTGANAKGAEVTQKSQKGIPKLFGKGWKQCLCGLQGINGWEGAWGLLVGGLLCFGLCGLWASWFNPASYQNHSQQPPAAIRPPLAHQARAPSFPRRRESMPLSPLLWIPAYAGMTAFWVCFC